MDIKVLENITKKLKTHWIDRFNSRLEITEDKISVGRLIEIVHSEPSRENRLEKKRAEIS